MGEAKQKAELVQTDRSANPAHTPRQIKALRLSRSTGIGVKVIPEIVERPTGKMVDGEAEVEQVHTGRTFVWEFDIDKAGNQIGALRPHYKEGDEGYPEGGYPAQ